MTDWLNWTLTVGDTMWYAACAGLIGIALGWMLGVTDRPRIDREPPP